MDRAVPPWPAGAVAKAACAMLNGRRKPAFILASPTEWPIHLQIATRREIDVKINAREFSGQISIAHGVADPPFARSEIFKKSEKK